MFKLSQNIVDRSKEIVNLGVTLTLKQSDCEWKMDIRECQIMYLKEFTTARDNLCMKALQLRLSLRVHLDLQIKKHINMKLH